MYIMELPGLAAGQLYLEKDTQMEAYTTLYGDLDIAYQQAHCGPFDDLSCRGDDVTVIAAIQDNTITGFGRPVVAFGNPRALKKEAQRLYGISHSIWSQDYLINGELSAFSKFLLSKGAIATPFYTQVIDLTKHGLHADIRKSYTSLINARFEHVIIGTDRYLLEMLKQLYYLNVPNPRPESTWEVQRKMLDAGEAFITADIGGGGGCLSAAFFRHNSQICHYFSGKSLDTHNSHAVVWRAILHAKDIGMRRIDLGEQVFYPQQTKQVGISTFKAGFGGTTQTYLRIRSY